MMGQPLKRASGFSKPVKVSNVILSILGKKDDELASRTEITKFLCNYIKDNKLQDTNNRSVFIPDTKLAPLFATTPPGVDKNAPITFFSMHKYLQSHYLKDENEEK